MYDIMIPFVKLVGMGVQYVFIDVEFTDSPATVEGPLLGTRKKIKQDDRSLTSYLLIRKRRGNVCIRSFKHQFKSVTVSLKTKKKKRFRRDIEYLNKFESIIDSFSERSVSVQTRI